MQEPVDYLAGSTLLHALDTFALNNLNTSHTFQTNNTGMESINLLANGIMYLYQLILLLS